MGRPKPPTVKYIPAPPPPVTVSTPTQSLRSQIQLTKISGEQNRLNMETGARLDRVNEEFYTGQDLRRYRARGAEERLTARQQGIEQRATTRVSGQEERRTVGERGRQDRFTTMVRGREERRAIGARGQ